MRHANRRCGEGKLEGSKSMAFRVSLALNVILALVVAACGVYKFTDIRNVMGGGGVSREHLVRAVCVASSRSKFG